MAVTLDQHNDTDALLGQFYLRDTTSDELNAQKFVPTRSGELNKIDIYSARIGSPGAGNVWMEIWTDSGGSPGTKIGGNSATMTASTISTSAAYLEFTWSSDYPNIIAGASYWIVQNGDYAIGGASTNNCIYWGVNDDPAFTIGQRRNATTWSAVGTSPSYTFAFKQYSSPTSAGFFAIL